MTRAMRCCPHPCAGYEPVAGEQEVHLLGGEWWRGVACPGALVAKDGTSAQLLSDFQVLEQFAGGSSLEWWRAQPEWWTEGIRECRRMRDAIEAEDREPRT